MSAHCALLVSILVAGTATLALAQPEPAFDVVSIRRNVGDGRNIINAPEGATVNLINVRLDRVAIRAYGVKSIVNRPAWMGDERYDIIAKTSTQPSTAQVDAMLRTMFKQRLQLAAHVEPRQTDVYALVVARSNHPGLKPFTRDCDAIRIEQEAAVRAGQQLPQPGPGSGPVCSFSWSSAIYSGGISLAELAGILDGVAGRPIVDRTGLPGRYEFTLRFTSPRVPPNEVPDVAPILFTALQEQLGLKLEPVRALVDTLVIDSIERPQEN